MLNLVVLVRFLGSPDSDNVIISTALRFLCVSTNQQWLSGLGSSSLRDQQYLSGTGAMKTVKAGHEGEEDQNILTHFVC